MIAVEGQYAVRFSIGDRRDFINEANFVSLTMVEEAGNYLPTFQLAFMLQDDEIFSHLHEGNDLLISFGREPRDLTNARMTITRLVSKRMAEARYVSLTGTYAAGDYLNQSQFLVTEPLSSVEAIRQRVSRYFPAFNAAIAPDDAMRWISPGWSDKRFVSEVWMHSHLPGSFPAIGISTDGHFVLKDVKAAMSQAPNWRITKDVRDPERDLVYNDDAEIELNSGFINSWVGYGRKQLIYNLEEGTSEMVESIPEPVVALTRKVAKRASIEARHAATGIINENMHPNYWRAYLNNIVSLGSFSSVSVTFSYSGRFYPMRVLDACMFKDDDVTRLRTASSEFNSGLYMVSKIARTIQNRQISTVVTMCRESFNAVR